MYTELIGFLRTQEVFIEAEARPDRMRNFIDEYNISYGESLSINDEGIILLQQDADKWGLELRLYINSCPPQPIMEFGFIRNRAYRNEYAYRLNDNKIINHLFECGYRIGLN